MTIDWTVSHGTRLVLAVAKGDLAPSVMLDFLAAIEREGAVAYRKIVDVTGMTTAFLPEQIRDFAQRVRERELNTPAGALAIVAGKGPLASQAHAFAEGAQLLRPIRVFAELHEARRWLDSLPAEAVEKK